MAYLRTLRGPRRGRFVPGSLACAAARPLTLTASVCRLGHIELGHIEEADKAPDETVAGATTEAGATPPDHHA